MSMTMMRNEREVARKSGEEKIEFRLIKFLIVVLSNVATPSAELPARTLLAPMADPPMVLNCAPPKIAMP